jgi:hypothetical protein
VTGLVPMHIFYPRYREPSKKMRNSPKTRHTTRRGFPFGYLYG